VNAGSRVLWSQHAPPLGPHVRCAPHAGMTEGAGMTEYGLVSLRREKQQVRPVAKATELATA